MTNDKCISGKIIKISGPLVVANQMQGTRMFDVVKVGDLGLMGEIIEVKGDTVSIQVYEETSGMKTGEPVISSGEPLSVELAPGILKSIYDGIQRPLHTIADKAEKLYSTRSFIPRGILVPALDREIKWEFVPCVKKGDKVLSGDVIGSVQETDLILHKIMVPPHISSGTVTSIQAGKFTIEEIIATIDDYEIKMLQKWPVRTPRPIKEKYLPTEPLYTGQRIIDTFFPVPKGGAAAIPGPFGAGKTVTQHQLAKWSDADIVVYVGCGERGNEMTDVLREFPHLKDPKSGKPLMERTVLIANTSNMPIAAREASVYTGITLAEYYRDMGYNVAMMADSTSRWAEAMREMSGRLEEMPGEEGYPAYLGSRISAFYERAGAIQCTGQEGRKGSLTVIAAVSPPGGDLSEPVTQSTLKVTKAFWGLDASLAARRHFPSINWLISYSLYTKNLENDFIKTTHSDWPRLRDLGMRILQEESKLEDIIKLLGMDALSGQEKILLDTAKGLREDFLQQNAFDDIDTYTSPQKMYLMLKAMLTFHEEATLAISKNKDLATNTIANLPIRDKIAMLKMLPEDELETIAELLKEIPTQINNLKPQNISDKTDLSKLSGGEESNLPSSEMYQS
jgi:V/A-type H+-transporting ATPase subunit A